MTALPTGPPARVNSGVALWRMMQLSDLDAVLEIAATVHPAFPERREVFAERCQLFPAGALVLERQGRLCAYALSHPWLWEDIPALDTLLGALPSSRDCYYFHDLALLPEARGAGQAQLAIERVCSLAREQGSARVAGVSVNQSYPFWLKQGFTEHRAPSLSDKLRSYEEGARYLVKAIIA